jgi:hypothetical protein
MDVQWYQPAVGKTMQGLPETRQTMAGGVTAGTVHVSGDALMYTRVQKQVQLPATLACSAAAGTTKGSLNCAVELPRNACAIPAADGFQNAARSGRSTR